MEYTRLPHGHLLQLLHSSYAVVHDTPSALDATLAKHQLQLVYDSRGASLQEHPHGVFMALAAPKYTASGAVLPLPDGAAAATQQLLAGKPCANPAPCGLLPLTILVAGTDFEDVRHLWADLELARDSLHSSCSRWLGSGTDRELPMVLVDLQCTMAAWLREYRDSCITYLRAMGYIGVHVTLAGHSLGGAIVDTAALMLPHNVGDTSSRPFPDFTTSFSSVSFESPGVPESVLRQYESSSNADSRMVSYLASPNLINTLYRHPGRVYHIAVDNLSPFNTTDVISYISVDCFRMLALYCGAAVTSTALWSRAAASVAAFAAQVGLEAQDMLTQHSLQYLSFAFTSPDGKPIPRMMRQMADWPLLFSAAGVDRCFQRAKLGILPSFLCGCNLGVWTLWEGKFARHMRLVQQMEGYTPVPESTSEVVPLKANAMRPAVVMLPSLRPRRLLERVVVNGGAWRQKNA